MPYKDQARQRAAVQKHYRNNKERYTERNRRRQGEMRRLAREYKSTHPCVLCGEDDPICLDFHHREPDEKKFSISDTGQIPSIARLVEEMEKCDVLCANCHRKTDERYRSV